jgi:hypothetical protein
MDAFRFCSVGGRLAFWMNLALASTTFAIPSFYSLDPRLPNPDRPYEMTSGTVHYDAPPYFALHDLEFQPSNPTQLDTPTRRSDGGLEFDSIFDLTYRAVVSIGLGPPYSVTGPGKARIVGSAPPNVFNGVYDSVMMLQVFDTEILELSLAGLSPIPEVMLRESPTTPSGGVTIRQDTCPVCAVASTRWRISSFFDVFTEVTFDGGHTWAAADRPIHLEQAPDDLPPGDYNKDQVVDAADYVVWRKTLGNLGAGLAADGNWSGFVDLGDLGAWAANFGQPSFVSNHVLSAPEPSAGRLIAPAAVLLIGCSHRAERRSAIRARC